MQSGGLRAKNITKQSHENMPLITVITVVYNGAKTLEETIVSVINQTYQNIEYIIVDGASTDNTLEIVKKYEDRIDYWISEPDKGIYDAMNKGINLAKGTIVGIVNSDDWYEPDACSLVVNEYLKGKPDVLFGNIKVHFENNIKSFKTANVPKSKKDVKYLEMHPSVFVLKHVYDIGGLFDIQYKIAADCDILIRIFLYGFNFKKIDSVITNFRDGGISSNNTGIREELKILRKHKYPKNIILNLHFYIFLLPFINFIKKSFPALLKYKRQLIQFKK